MNTNHWLGVRRLADAKRTFNVMSPSRGWLDRVSRGIDRAVSVVSPQRGLKRLRARVADDFLRRHYEGAASGRRTQGWNRTSADANAALGPAAARLRDAARDLVRNNPYAVAALNAICDHTVNWGIVAKTKDKRAQESWNRWANSTDCDADGRHDFAGLQRLVLSTVIESGEVLVRRRLRRPEDGLAIPMQLQVLEPDYLDTSKDTTVLSAGGIVTTRIIQGIEFDAIGRRVAYWLFPEHPGSTSTRLPASVRVPAESVLHIYNADRPGQVRGASWFAPVLLRFKDFDEYEDATLMKQKIAACLAVITTDVDGSAASLGGNVDTSTTPEIDSLEPGSILNVAPGREIKVVEPPSVREHSDYCKITLQAIATGMGCTYEDITGDYSDFNFSSARMSRLRHWARVYDWQWNLMVPQFCSPVWAWTMEVAQIMRLANTGAVAAWTPPPMPMIEPDKEGLAIQRNIRTGILTLSEAIRERGYDPRELLEEMAADNKMLDELGLVLDSDARKMTSQGQAQQQPSAEGVAA